jgi:predicted ribonuclease toxin of YeeF-YezG toxin-antitoxin module
LNQAAPSGVRLNELLALLCASFNALLLLAAALNAKNGAKNMKADAARMTTASQRGSGAAESVMNNGKNIKKIASRSRWIALNLRRNS